MAIMGMLADGAFAATVASASSEVPAVPSPNIGSSVVRILGALALVIGLFVGGAWLARNWHRVGRRPARLPELRLLEVKSLGARQALWIVGYRQQRLLVASSPAGITLLTPLPEAPPSDEALPAAPTIDFAEALRSVLTRRS